MHIKREPIPDYNRWPIRAIRFLLPTIAIIGFRLNGLHVHVAFWIWQAKFSINFN